MSQGEGEILKDRVYLPSQADLYTPGVWNPAGSACQASAPAVDHALVAKRHGHAIEASSLEFLGPFEVLLFGVVDLKGCLCSNEPRLYPGKATHHHHISVAVCCSLVQVARVLQVLLLGEDLDLSRGEVVEKGAGRGVFEDGESMATPGYQHLGSPLALYQRGGVAVAPCDLFDLEVRPVVSDPVLRKRVHLDKEGGFACFESSQVQRQDDVVVGSVLVEIPDVEAAKHQEAAIACRDNSSAKAACSQFLEKGHGICLHYQHARTGLAIGEVDGAGLAHRRDSVVLLHLYSNPGVDQRSLHVDGGTALHAV